MTYRPKKLPWITHYRHVELPPLPPGYSWRRYAGEPAVIWDASEGNHFDFPYGWVSRDDEGKYSAAKNEGKIATEYLQTEADMSLEDAVNLLAQWFWLGVTA